MASEKLLERAIKSFVSEIDREIAKKAKEIVALQEDISYLKAKKEQAKNNVLLFITNKPGRKAEINDFCKNVCLILDAGPTSTEKIWSDLVAKGLINMQRGSFSAYFSKMKKAVRAVRKRLQEACMVFDLLGTTRSSKTERRV